MFQSLNRSNAMNNPVVVVTGALTGIGRAAAVAFAKKGAKLVVAGRRDEAGKALVKELRSLGSAAEQTILTRRRMFSCRRRAGCCCNGNAVAHPHLGPGGRRPSSWRGTPKRQWLLSLPARRLPRNRDL